MIGATYSVPDACIGSAQSLGRSLSLVDRVSAESSPATHRRRLFSRWQPFPHLPTDQFFHRIRHRKLPKNIQYPEARSGSVQ
jgi:hypothetical protein